MNDKQQINAFAEEIDRLVDRYRKEFDLSYASVIGVFFMKAQILCSESEEKDL